MAHAVALAEVSDWFEVLRAGEWKRDGRDLTITPDHLARAAENFRRLGDHRIPVDYDHSFALGGESRAAGWIDELRFDGNALEAKVEWTDRARELISGDEYRYFSSEFDFEHADETGEDWGFTLLAGGLTNRPFLRGMGAVALSEAAHSAALAEAEEAVNGLARAGDGLTDSVSDIQGEMATDGTESRTVTLTEEAHERLLDGAGRVETMSAEIQALTSRVESAEKALFAERFGALLADARRAGRIDSRGETTEKWRKRAERFGLDEARDLLMELPTETIPMSEIGHGQDKPPADAAPEGVSPDAYTFDQHVRAHMAEHGEKSYVAAALALEKKDRV